MKPILTRTGLVGVALFATLALLSGGLVAHASDGIPPAPRDTGVFQEEADGDIIEVATAAGDFTTLLAAIDAAGLTETLQGDGPFTVFAPTDAAFDALPEGTLDALLADPDALSEVLLYHVVSGEVMAADVVELTSATTAQGADIQIEVSNGNVILNGDVNVVATDIQATNGVIHVIDGVLLPPDEEPAEPADPEEPAEPEPAETGGAGLLGASSGGTAATPLMLMLGGMMLVTMAGGAMAWRRIRSR